MSPVNRYLIDKASLLPATLCSYPTVISHAVRISLTAVVGRSKAQRMLSVVHLKKLGTVWLVCSQLPIRAAVAII